MASKYVNDLAVMANMAKKEGLLDQAASLQICSERMLRLEELLFSRPILQLFIDGEDDGQAGISFK